MTTREIDKRSNKGSVSGHTKQSRHVPPDGGLMHTVLCLEHHLVPKAIYMTDTMELHTKSYKSNKKKGDSFRFTRLFLSR